VSYASKQDLIDRFGEDGLVKLTDLVNRPPTTIDDTMVARALTDTDSLINSYLAGRYTVPLITVPSVLNAYACSIARFKIHRDRASERVAADYSEALKWLGLVSAGAVSLADAEDAPTEQTSGSTVKTNSPARTFTRDSMKGL
jgi:phage gp36-like protein